MENNKIGTAIQYFRESYNITQYRLCKGLCSAATLSRIETGEREVDSLLIETLLERLGKAPNQFELILTDLDYELYQEREEIRKQINARKYEFARDLLDKYEKKAASKGNVHMQFIIYNKALLNERHEGAVETTIELLTEAITYTVPDFKTSRLKNYYLSNSELNIIIDIIQRMITAGMVEKAKEELTRVIDYLDLHKSVEENSKLYLKVAVIAGGLYLHENELNKAINVCNWALEKNKGNIEMDYVGELCLIKAQVTERLLKAQQRWDSESNECLNLFLQAYYIFDVCDDFVAADKIKKYLEEEYRWAGID